MHKQFSEIWQSVGWPVRQSVHVYLLVFTGEHSLLQKTVVPGIYILLYNMSNDMSKSEAHLQQADIQVAVLVIDSYTLQL